MTVVYRVSSTKTIHHSSPLHVSNFFPNKQRWHQRKMQDRQDLILYLAKLHADSVSSGMPLGMIHIPMRLMTLRDWVQDYRVVLDEFFEVIQLGYNLGEKHDVSTLIPKPVTVRTFQEASSELNLEYALPIIEGETVQSKVFVQQKNCDSIIQRLRTDGRLDLLSPVRWLLSKSELVFHFRPAGRLKLRDTSVYPVQAIETWPSWLRESLFGEGLDIDSAYTQFLLFKLQDTKHTSQNLLKLLYPDLLKSVSNKAEFRRELCEDILRIEFSSENISKIKQLCMCVANGSRISPAILLSGGSYSECAEIIKGCVTDLSPTNLIRIGKRFESIARQFSTARRAICSMSNQRASRQNLKEVFCSYFAWEREARYAIWELVGRHGIMVHDGIDGVPQQYIDQLPELIRKLGIKLTA